MSASVAVLARVVLFRTMLARVTLSDTMMASRNHFRRCLFPPYSQSNIHDLIRTISGGFILRLVNAIGAFLLPFLLGECIMCCKS